MALRETWEEAERLRRDLDRFMRNVRPTSEPGHPVYEVEKCHETGLRLFFAGLLSAASVPDAESVWPLLEACVPPGLLDHPEVRQEKDFLAQPLAGAPTEILTRLHLYNEKSAWAEVRSAVRTRLSEPQAQAVFLVEQSLSD